MNELTTTGILSLLDTTKAQRQSFVLDLISKLEDGEADPIKVKLQVKKMEDLVKQINEDARFKELVIDEAVKHGKSFEMYNAKFEIRSLPAKLDYSTCNDAEYTRLLTSIETLKAQLKDRETFLKGLPAIGMETITEDGEVVRLYPPVKGPSGETIVPLTVGVQAKYKKELLAKFKQIANEYKLCSSLNKD